MTIRIRFLLLLLVWVLPGVPARGEGGVGGGAADRKPLKVYLLAGQSNMQGHAAVATFDSLAGDPKTAPLLRSMRGEDLLRVVPDYDPEQGYELAGFVWFQGFNDYVDGWTYPERNRPGGYDVYADLLGPTRRPRLRSPLQGSMVSVSAYPGRRPAGSGTCRGLSRAAPAGLRRPDLQVVRPGGVARVGFMA